MGELLRTPLGTIDRTRLDRVRAALAEENRSWPPTMTYVPSRRWPHAFVDALTTAEPLCVWRSSRYLAVLYQEPGKAARRLSVCRTVLNDDGGYQDGLTWDELQRVKSECGYADRDAVELYPRDVDVVNVSNMRHLWILPALSELTWR